MVYRNARLVHSWNETYQYEQTQLVYDAPKKPGERTYGGLLAENVVSAISRDLLAASMLTCEANAGASRSQGSARDVSAAANRPVHALTHERLVR
jgi:hypothetical protein